MANTNQQGIDKPPEVDKDASKEKGRRATPTGDQATAFQRDQRALVKGFFRRYPDAVVLVVVVVLYPVFAATLPPKTSASTLVWFILILVGSISFVRTIHRVFTPTDPGEGFRRFLSRAVAILVLAPFAALSVAVVLALVYPGKSFGAIGRIADLLLGAEPTEAIKDPPQVSTAQAPMPSIPAPPAPRGTSAFAECLSNAYKANDPKAIVNCTERLPK
jgi:hypothetical protein